MESLNRKQARELTRQIIRDNLQAGEVEGSWHDDALNRYLQIASVYAYDKERTFNKASFVNEKTLTGNGTYFPLLPPNFNGVYQIVTEEEGVPYELIALESKWEYTKHTKTGYAYYEQDYKIGLCPLLSTVSDTALLYFYRNFIPWADNKKTDLHYYSCMVACTYAGQLALEDRGDVNTRMVAAELARWEALIPHTRIRSRNPFPIRLHQRWRYGGKAPIFQSYVKP